MSLIHVTKDNFAEVKASDKPVLLDFFATWCGPCRMISPFIEQIAEEHPEYVIAKIDVDEEPELAQAFGVQSIPTLVVLKGGEVVNTAVGGRPKAAILDLLK
jgi:thioredoxin 1